MDSPQAQVVNRLKESNNVLVTVSKDPSVDQLSAAIGLTILLNKMGKHAAAVFSGEVPERLDFLKPNDTIEKTTDSLRDFIISLDKSKADKLRYKLEGDHVRIFITPYRTSITEQDLDFSQGDLNVDTVMALGVQDQSQLDQAIITHGRILHDATVITLNTSPGGTMGAINWVNEKTSSYGEMLVGVIDGLKTDVMDSQIATALLTGIVAETERFSNEKTAPQTMSASAKLMAAGANQQLIATELKTEIADAAIPTEPTSEAPTEPEVVPDDKFKEPAPLSIPAEEEEPPKEGDGSLSIGHESAPESVVPDAEPEPKEAVVEEIHIDEHGELQNPDELAAPAEISTLPPVGGGLSTDLPAAGQFLGGNSSSSMLTASTLPDDITKEKSSDPLSNPVTDTPILSHSRTKPEDYMPKVSRDSLSDSVPAAPIISPEPPMPAAPWPEPAPAMPFPPATPIPSGPIPDNQTLVDLEKAVQSPHVADDGAIPPLPPLEPPVASSPPPPGLTDARDAVSMALSANPGEQPLPPLQAIGSQPLDLNVQGEDVPPLDPTVNPVMPPMPDLAMPVMDAAPAPFPPAMPTPDNEHTQFDPSQFQDPVGPPPVPPPLTPMPPVPDMNMPPMPDMNVPPAPDQSNTQLPNSPTPYNPFLPPS